MPTNGSSNALPSKWDLPFVADRADVREYARNHKLSLEMAARTLRHDFLARSRPPAEDSRPSPWRIMRTIRSNLFFLRLLRGAGGEGLAGMKWQSPSPRDSKIMLVRPLLDQSKAALQTYAKQERVPFREDATNAQLDIQRNRIRHELLPLLTRNYQPALARVILRQMDILGAEAAFVNEAALDWLKLKRRPKFETLPVALQRRCLQLQLAQQGVAANFDLIEQIREIANRPVVINEGISVCRDADGRVQIRQISESGFNNRQIEVNLSGRAGEIVFENARITWEIKPAGFWHFSCSKAGGELRIFRCR